MYITFDEELDCFLLLNFWKARDGDIAGVSEFDRVERGPFQGDLG